MAKKKGRKHAKAKKSGKDRKAKPLARRPRFVPGPGMPPTFVFVCVAGRCLRVTPLGGHIGRDWVMFTASNTNVTIEFLDRGSPFELQENPITIKAGEPYFDFVLEEAEGHYKYNPTCVGCKKGRRVLGPPEMIVP